MYRFETITFELSRKLSNGDLCLMVKGPEYILAIVKNNFPALYFASKFADSRQRFDWGVFIKSADDEAEARLRAFLQFLVAIVFIDDDLDLSHALMYHSDMGSKTAMGQLVYDAKPYHHPCTPQHRTKAKELANHLVKFIALHPVYHQADILVSVPPSNPSKDFDLPTELVTEIARQTGQATGFGGIKKIRSTGPMKDCPEEDKAVNIAGAFAVEPSYFAGKTVVVVDDIYDSGCSLNEVGRTIRLAGAKSILGLTATKTRR